MEFQKRLNLSSLAQNSSSRTFLRNSVVRRKRASSDSQHCTEFVSAEPRANSMNRLFPYEARTFCIFNERVARVQTVAHSFLVSSQTSLRVLSIISTFRTRSGIIDDRSTFLPIRPRFFFFFSFFRTFVDALFVRSIESTINFRRGRLRRCCVILD